MTKTESSLDAHLSSKANPNGAQTDESAPVATSQQDQQGSGCSKPRACLCPKCCKKIPYNWPRTYSLVCCVILPLWLLIGISILFGAGLARLESFGEYFENDAWMASRAKTYQSILFLGNVSMVLPSVCLQIYLDPNVTLDDLEDILLELVPWTVTNSLGVGKNESALGALDLLPQCNGTSTSTSNESSPEWCDGTNISDPTDLLEFMKECGRAAEDIAEESFFKSLVDVAAQEVAGLSFNWIRCVGRNSQCRVNAVICDILGLNSSQFAPEAQEAVYATAWNSSFHGIFHDYFEQFTDEGIPRGKAATMALNISAHEATGRDNCTVNVPSGTWFWFTVMTTIGYGNQAPETKGGRAMVFTLGFFSILAFGVVLAGSGYIVTSIFDDMIRRVKFGDFLSTPFMGSVLWGSLWLSWMLIIAGYYVHWKQDRLGKAFDYGDAYWFSYVSTTTVGLGDFFLEPEVIQTEDMIIFPVLFLFGFVLLANFLAKFTELIIGFLPERENTFHERLEQTKLFDCRPEKNKPAEDEEKALSEAKDEEAGPDEWYEADEFNGDENNGESPAAFEGITSETAVVTNDATAS